MESWRGPVIGVGALVAVIVFSALLDIKLVSALVNGLQLGSVFALVALGVALVYKATRVMNFAQGEIGTMSAWVVWLVLVGFNITDEADATTSTLPTLLGATVLALVVGAVLAILINTLVVQRLAQASPVTSLVATAGVMVLLTAVQLVVFDAKGRPFPRFIEGAPNGIDAGPICLAKPAANVVVEEGQCVGDLAIGGLIVPWHTLVVIIVLVIAAGLLAIFFRTPPGVALLATAQDPFAAEIQGVSVRAMSALAWGMAGALGALGGILGAGVYKNLSPGLMTTTFLIPALVAAVLGGVTSMVGAVLGGLILGVSVAYVTEMVLALDLTSTLPGPPQIATFTVLILALLLRPRGLFGKEA